MDLSCTSISEIRVKDWTWAGVGEGKERIGDDLSTLRWGRLGSREEVGSEEGGGLQSFVVDVISGQLTQDHWGQRCPVGSDLDV